MNQFNAHSIRGFDKSDTRRGTKIHGIDRKLNPVFLEVPAKLVEITIHPEPEMIRSPLYSGFPLNLFSRPLAANNNGGPLKETTIEGAPRTSELLTTLPPSFSSYQAAEDLGSLLTR